MRKVPRVDLLNPEVEPQDWEVDLLLESVVDKVNLKTRQTHEKLMSDLKAAIRLSTAKND